MDRPWIEAGLKISLVRETDLPALLVQRVSRLRGTEQLDTRYLYYTLVDQNFTSYVKNVQTGTGVPHISPKQINSYQIPLPPIGIQRGIADILGSLDDKIELNRRMNETLEQMSLSLYKHWFVDFGPFHDRGYFESELGDIPYNWKIQEIGTLAEVKGGKRLPKGKSILSEKTDYPYIRVKDFNQYGVDFRSVQYIDEETHQSIKRYIITSDDIYISIAGTVGLAGIIPSILSGANLTENAARITGITREYRNYLLLYLRTTGQDEIRSRIVGSTQPKLPLYNIKGIRVVVPDADSLNKFNAIVDPILMQIEVNELEILELEETRNYLLPRLLSGEIEVKAAVEQVKEVLAGA